MKEKFKSFTTKLKKLHKKYGWKAVVAIFFYYLIRDVTLYIILPLYALKAIKQ